MATKEVGMIKQIPWLWLLVAAFIAYSLNIWLGIILGILFIGVHVDKASKITDVFLNLWMFFYCTLALPMALVGISIASEFLGRFFTWLSNLTENILNWGRLGVYISFPLLLLVGFLLMMYIKRKHKV